MRKGLALLCGLSLMGGLLAMPRPCAYAKAGSIDKELLGVRLLQSYKTVLQLYGQPTRIFRADESINLLFKTGPDGKQTGGVSGIGDSSAAGGPGGAMGMPGSGGPMMGAPGGSGGPMFGGGKGAEEGLPGFPSSGGGAPSGGLGTGATSDKSPTFAESGGFTWVYFYPREELAYVFFFNKDGRVEMISEYGRNKGKPSSRGIHLGDVVRSVYGTYGWPDTVEPQLSVIALNYNLKHHALFNVLDGKVTSISVILQESNYPHLVAQGSATAGGPGGAMGMPGSGGPMLGGPAGSGGRPGPAASGGRRGGGKFGNLGGGD